MRVDDGIRIRHMVDAAEAALGFVQGRARGDLDILWVTVQRALPDLLAQLKSLHLPG